MGYRPRADHAKAYVALWRHIGFYMGLPVPMLRKYLGSYEDAECFFASMLLNVFSDLIPADPSGRDPAVSMLATATKRGPSWPPFSYHLAIARTLLGDEPADVRGIPKPTFPMSVAVKLTFYLLNAPVYFGYWYIRRGWLNSYTAMVRNGLVGIVRWGLGVRVVTFYPYVPLPGNEKKLESGEDCPEPVPWRYYLFLSSLLFAEMFVVLLLALVVPLTIVYFARRD